MNMYMDMLPVPRTLQEIGEPFLPPGYRFHPTDEELVVFYLANKVADSRFSVAAIGEVDLNKCEPWDLPAIAKMGEKEWYFFSLKDRKYPTGLRTNRATEAGYWKATGKDREVMSTRHGCLVGMKKTLVFYKGRAPKGEKTNWIMHEYRLEGEASLLHLSRTMKDEWVVCRIFRKNIGGKKIASDSEPQCSSLPALLESPRVAAAQEDSGVTDSEGAGLQRDTLSYLQNQYSSMKPSTEMDLWVSRERDGRAAATSDYPEMPLEKGSTYNLGAQLAQDLRAQERNIAGKSSPAPVQASCAMQQAAMATGTTYSPSSFLLKAMLEQYSSATRHCKMEPHAAAHEASPALNFKLMSNNSTDQWSGNTGGAVQHHLVQHYQQAPADFATQTHNPAAAAISSPVVNHITALPCVNGDPHSRLGRPVADQLSHSDLGNLWTY